MESLSGKESTKRECEKIDNMLLKLEYELLGSSLSINLLPSFLSLVPLCSEGERSEREENKK